MTTYFVFLGDWRFTIEVNAQGIVVSMSPAFKNYQFRGKPFDYLKSQWKTAVIHEI